MTADQNARIQERAYHLWLEEGCPHGRDREHWYRAERETVEQERSLREAPPATALCDDAGAAVAGSRSSDQPEAGPQARRSRPATAGSVARGGRRTAATKQAK
jgi:hypothetical protein